VNTGGRIPKDEGQTRVGSADQGRGSAGRDGVEPVLDREALGCLTIPRAPDNAADAATDIDTPPAEDKRDEDFESQVDQRLSMILHHEEVQVMAAVIKRVNRDRPAERGSA
jgi:hypothetical protein